MQHQDEAGWCQNYAVGLLLSGRVSFAKQTKTIYDLLSISTLCTTLCCFMSHVILVNRILNYYCNVTTRQNS